jgi:hypothetical protein
MQSPITIGHLLNLGSLGNDTGIAQPTAREWLTLLEASYIVFRHPLRGMLFENMVIVEVMKYFLNRDPRRDLWFYRDSNGPFLVYGGDRVFTHLDTRVTGIHGLAGALQETVST